MLPCKYILYRHTKHREIALIVLQAEGSVEGWLAEICILYNIPGLRKNLSYCKLELLLPRVEHNSNCMRENLETEISF